ncbi:MAG: hypothetical protein ACUVXA_13785 [Candidatus Jordarchaeum sp.]|uniref:hypothetical protein n=1 Tax=Candidatus Jordarchaeum sp. TaxID=2823881 RepID=UPI00404A37DF
MLSEKVNVEKLMETISELTVSKGPEGMLNTFNNAVIFGSLLSALENMGIPTTLTARRASDVLKGILKVVDKVLLGKEPATSLEELPKDFMEAVKNSQFVEEVDVKVSNNVMSGTLKNCIYLGFGKIATALLGYERCPICALCMVGAATVEALEFGQVTDMNIKTNGNICHLEMKIEPK